MKTADELWKGYRAVFTGRIPDHVMSITQLAFEAGYVAALQEIAERALLEVTVANQAADTRAAAMEVKVPS